MKFATKPEKALGPLKWTLFFFEMGNRLLSPRSGRQLVTDETCLRITPDMSEEEVIQACASAVVDAADDQMLAELKGAATLNGCASALDFVLASMRQERASFDTLEGWLATLPGRHR